MTAPRDLASRGGVLSLSAAAARLPIRRCEARAWLRSRGLTSDLAGREVVLWPSVLAELSASRCPGARDDPAPVVRHSRLAPMGRRGAR